MKGTIKDFQGSWGSGLATLLMEGPEGQIDTVFCDNAQTVRAFADCYSNENIIIDGHCVNTKVLIGKKIKYETDGMILTSFCPA